MAATALRPRSTPSTWSVVHLAGEVDVATAARVRRRLARAAEGPARDVVIDLTGVTFVDCAGLSPLLEARHRLGNRLWLRGLPAPVTRLLQLTGAHTTFAVLDAAALPAEDPVRQR